MMMMMMLLLLMMVPVVLVVVVVPGNQVRCFELLLKKWVSSKGPCLACSIR